MAQNAKDIQLRDLKDLLNELRETNKLLQKTLEETQREKAVLQQERDNFKEQVDYLTKKLFGSSSEKGTCEIPGQMHLFNDAESEMDPSAETADALAATELPEKTDPEKPAKKKRSTNEERFKSIPVKKVYLEPSAEELICSKCGNEMVRIGTEFVRRELKIIPARATVIEYYSVNYETPVYKIFLKVKYKNTNSISCGIIKLTKPNPTRKEMSLYLPLIILRNFHYS